jgi:uncharacterized protein YukJ
MPIPNYSVLKGKATGGKVQFNRNGNSPHYLIDLKAGGQKFQAAVNIESQDGSEVLYRIDRSFTPPNPSGLVSLPAGWTAIESVEGGLALDYVRSRVKNNLMVDRSSMSLLPVAQGAEDSDLRNAVVDLLDQAVADGDGTLYAFGSFYQEPGQSSGIHDIHMNQGNPADNHGADNGVWQDGAVFINLAAKHLWVAIFIAFQSQSWRTDYNGDPA